MRTAAVKPAIAADRLDAYHRRRGLAESRSGQAQSEQNMWLASAQQVAKLRLKEVSMLSSRVSTVSAARNLDNPLSMSAQVAATCRSGY